MPLIIPQGKQDTTQDNKFNPITAQDVLLEITELKLAKTQANTLEVTLRILDGQHKNRFIFDRVTFDANSPMSWKYRQLRKCAGVAYQDNEPTSIDIEALLLHKAVKADLSIRKGTNRNGEEQEYQDIKYKVIDTKQSSVQPGSVFSNSTPTPSPVTPAKKTTKAKPTPVETKQEDTDTNASDFEDILPQTPQASSIAITDEDDWD